MTRSLALLAVAPLQIRAIGPQSVLRTSGPAAGEIGDLWNVLLIVAVAVSAVTFGALTFAIVRRRKGPAYDAHQLDRDRKAARAVVVAGVAVPAVILSGVFALTMKTLGATSSHDAGTTGHDPVNGSLVVEISGQQYWWRVRYLDADSLLEFETANELRIPVGAPVQLRLRSRDVIHSFWVPSLHGKMDLIPGHLTTMTLQADREGMWRGQCAEFCGLQHTLMALQVVATGPAEFANWQREQRRGATPSAADDAEISQGRELFMRVGCAPCHSIRGTAANGTSGPDLTHVGSRLTLAAGSFPNTVDNLRSWIAKPELHKRGSGMPSLSLTNAQAGAIARYLASLQ